MKIRTSLITASILKDHCKVSDDLAEQIDNLPIKAEKVFLQVSQSEMENAAISLKKFMETSDGYHTDTFDSVLKEIEYYANCGKEEEKNVK